LHRSALTKLRYTSAFDSNVGFFVSFSGTLHVTTDRFVTFATKPSLGLKKYALM
jgi:hypothetical protein